MIGAKAEEERDLNVTFPEQYHSEALAGKDAVFSVTVKEVRAPKAAEVDDSLAERFGVENLDEMKSQIRTRLGNEYKGAGRSHMKRHLLDALNEKLDFALPESMVDNEAKAIAHQLWHEEHPEVEGHDHGEIEPTEEHRQLAERRVRLGLLFSDVGQKASIEVTDAEINQAADGAGSALPGAGKSLLRRRAAKRRIASADRRPAL